MSPLSVLWRKLPANVALEVSQISQQTGARNPTTFSNNRVSLWVHKTSPTTVPQWSSPKKSVSIWETLQLSPEVPPPRSRWCSILHPIEASIWYRYPLITKNWTWNRTVELKVPKTLQKSETIAQTKDCKILKLKHHKWLRIVASWINAVEKGLSLWVMFE